MAEFDVMSHQLVPKQIVITVKENEEILKKYKIMKEQLPKILITDPCVKRIGAKLGDIIKVIRNSPTSGTSETYRLVIDIV
jgi:DNA-directed RNA polymerase subunit H